MRGRPFSTPFLLNTRPAISGQGSPTARLSRVFRQAFLQKGRQLRAAAPLMPPPCTRSRRVRRPARGGGGRFSVLPFCPLPFFPTPFCRADPGAGREANAPPRGFPGFFAKPFFKKASAPPPLSTASPLRCIFCFATHGRAHNERTLPCIPACKAYPSTTKSSGGGPPPEQFFSESKRADQPRKEQPNCAFHTVCL